jgi:hypothetical protein
VEFRASSETFSLAKLLKMTKLKPTEAWAKGDLIPDRGRIKRKKEMKYKFNQVNFALPYVPGPFEEKLSSLLDFLEQDPKGVSKIAKVSDSGIAVVVYLHNGNGMIGGPQIDSNLISRMAKLSLGIHFDIYATGNLFR